MIILHDPHHYTMGQLIMYGKEVIYAKSSSVSGTFSAYTVEPLEVNHVSKDDRPCISEEEQEEDAPDLWECLTDHMHSKMNCTLPWKQKANEKDVHLCSSPQEHNLFYTKVVRGAREYNSEYIEKVAKCSPRCKRVEYSAKLMVVNEPDPTLIDQWEFRDAIQ